MLYPLSYAPILLVRWDSNPRPSDFVVDNLYASTRKNVSNYLRASAVERSFRCAFQR